MGASRFLAFFAFVALVPLAACASPHHTGGVGNSEFVPAGPLLVTHHVGLVGTNCAPPPSGPLGIEAPAGEGVFRISNRSNERVDFYYDSVGSFGDYQMFFVRYRDGAGTLLNLHHGGCGWWSPKEHHAELHPSGQWPHRDRVRIPAGGSIDIRRDDAALSYWWGMGGLPNATGPCQMQVRLFGYLGRRTWEGVGAETPWLPAPCPVTPVR